MADKKACPLAESGIPWKMTTAKMIDGCPHRSGSNITSNTAEVASLKAEVEKLTKSLKQARDAGQLQYNERNKERDMLEQELSDVQLTLTASEQRVKDLEGEVRSYVSLYDGLHSEEEMIDARNNLRAALSDTERTSKEPREQFYELLKEVIKKIDQIDKDTQWSEREPKWWLDMSEVRRGLAALQEGGK